MPIILFWLFSLVMLIGAIAVVCFRNPVSSALSMVVSFAGLAGLFLGLDAYFAGIIQILVYAGAIMVLFLFIIMLLDLKAEEHRSPKFAPIIGGLGIFLAFTIQLAGILSKSQAETLPTLDLKSAASRLSQSSPGIARPLAAGSLPDVHLIGYHLFTEYNLPLQIIGTLLLVATVGVVVLSKKEANTGK